MIEHSQVCFRFSGKEYTYSADLLTQHLELYPCEVSLDDLEEDIVYDNLWTFFSGKTESFIPSNHPGSHDFQNPEHRILHHFIATTIVPRAGSFHFVTYTDLLIMWCVVHNIKFNLPWLIFTRMHESIIQRSTNKLPYGMIISLILSKTVGPILFKSVPHSSFDTYSSKSLKRMGIKYENGTWKMPSKEDQQAYHGEHTPPRRMPQTPGSSSYPHPQSSPQSHPQTGLRFISSSISKLLEGQEALLSRIDKLEER